MTSSTIRARALDRGVGIESANKDKKYRKLQALSLYEHIYTEFPDCYRADEAMYRAGVIYDKYINDMKAKEVFSRLISDYPDSKYAERAKRRYRKLDLPSKEIKEQRELNLDILTKE